jgi:hypothetical protein
LTVLSLHNPKRRQHSMQQPKLPANAPQEQLAFVELRMPIGYRFRVDVEPDEITSLNASNHGATRRSYGFVAIAKC